MDILYYINPNGIITRNGVAIPMKEGHTLHNEYVQYLRSGGTVGETEDLTTADSVLLYSVDPNVTDLSSGPRALTHTQTLEQILTPVIEAPIAIPDDIKNVKLGYHALLHNKKGIDNVAIGPNALNHNVSSGNVGIGKGSLATNREGANNTAVGRFTLASMVRGIENIAIGMNAGKITLKNKSNNQSNGSIFIGANTKPLEDKGENEIVIGTNAIGNGSNTITIGNDKNKKIRIHGQLQSDGYAAADGSIGITTTFKTLDGLLIIVKNGLIVAINKNKDIYK